MTNILNPGDCIPVNGSILSPNGTYSLVLQGDGNLVLYQYNYTPFWASYTQGKQVAKAVMQADGNFMVYDTANNAIWNSMTANRSGISSYYAKQW